MKTFSQILTELSDTTKHSYIEKARKNRDQHDLVATSMHSRGLKLKTDKHLKVVDKRTKGLNRAFKH